MTTTKTIYMLAGSKGGVGKSLTAMALLDYLKLIGVNPFLIETDTSNPDVFKAYQHAVDCELLDLDVVDGWLELLNHCASLADRVIVINSAARNNQAVAKFGEHLVMGIEELQMELMTLWLINEQRDSLELLKQYRVAMPVSAVHVVRNEKFGTKFELYAHSDVRRDVESSGGQSLNLPVLADRVTQELYGGRRLTIDAVATSSAVPFGSRIEAKRWRCAVGRMFGQVIG
jgi:hypothetical protein